VEDISISLLNRWNLTIRKPKTKFRSAPLDPFWEASHSESANPCNTPYRPPRTSTCAAWLPTSSRPHNLRSLRLPPERMIPCSRISDQQYFKRFTMSSIVVNITVQWYFFAKWKFRRLKRISDSLQSYLKWKAEAFILHGSSHDSSYISFPTVNLISLLPHHDKTRRLSLYWGVFLLAAATMVKTINATQRRPKTIEKATLTLQERKRGRK